MIGVGLHINRAGENGAMKWLEMPAVVDEFVREIFQKLLMRRLFAADAKVADGANQLFAKMMLPDSIDHHAGQQRASTVVGVGDPLRQCSTLPCGMIGRNRAAGGRKIFFGGLPIGKDAEKANLERLFF